MKTRAAVALEPGRPFEILELDLQGPKRDEVLVRMLACGLCHTDVHSASGAEPWREFPFVPGHEGCAIVEDCGSDVTSLKPGDKVIPLYKSECGHCTPCLSKRSNNCETIMPTQKRGVLPDGHSRFSLDGKPVLHYMGCSAFSQFTVAPEISFAKIPAEAEPDEICLLGCAVTTGLGAVLEPTRVPPGSTVAVFGLGGIGLAVVQGARIAGASRIIAVDPNHTKFELARQFGASDTFDPSGAVEAIAEITGGGCDFSFEAAGSIAAMQDAIEAAHPNWGTCCILGNTPADARLSLHPGAVLGGRRIHGCTFGGVMGRSGLPRYAEMAANGELDLAPFITHRLPLDEINSAVDLMKSGQSIRSVITF